MTLRLSTKLRQRLMGVQVTITASTLAAVAAGQKITDSGNGLLAAGFLPGMLITISGFTGEATNNTIAVVTSVASDGSEMVVDPAVALLDDPAGEEVTITAEAQSFKDIFAYGVMCIYTGSQPASADVAPTGTELLRISKSAGTVTKGTATNGLEFDDPVAGVLGKKDADTWSDVGLATGTAGWFRFYANDIDVTAGALCFDGAVGTSGAELNLSSTSIVLAATTTIDEFEITLPAS